MNEVLIGAAWTSCLALALAATPTGTPKATETPPATTDDEVVLHVAADDSAPYASIQDALDAAPAGATVQVAPGRYEETLHVTRPVVLRGAGADTTRVVGAPAALRIVDAEGVQVRGLRFASPGFKQPGTIMRGGNVLVQGAEVLLEDCIMAEGPASGLVLEPRADVVVQRCLVTGMGSEGIVVQPGAKALIRDCDVRNVHHYGIVIGPDTRATVEGCRISGTGWHGIRYDDASPIIRGNRIFENERTGIYADGATAAQVTGNLFHANGMVGISCWGANADTIEGNTFSANLRSGLEILGLSNPRITRNVFVANGIGVANSNVVAGSPFVARQDGIVLDDNTFWDNATHARFIRGEGELDPAADQALLQERGNVVTDPGFVDAAGGDYTLRDDSPARARGVGVAEPLGFESPWPTQPEEQPILEASARKLAVAAAEAAAPSRQTAYELSGPWIEAVLQIDDAERKAAGLASIRTALASEDEARQLAGLTAFLGSVEGNPERASFRELILPILDSPHGSVQRQAFYALYNAGAQPGDLDRLLLTAHEDPIGFGDSAAHLIFLFSDGHIDGAASDVLLGLFQTDDSDKLTELLRGLWGARLSAELEQRVLELMQTRDHELRGNVIYFGLSTLQGKSDAVLDVLFEVAQGINGERAQRALWGLSHGVEAPQHGRVAEFALKLYASRDWPNTRHKCLGLIESYAGPDQRAALQAMADIELVPEEHRARVRQVLARLPAD